VPDDHQHTVPQLLLRNFATGNTRNRQIWVFEKQTGREFRTAVRNVATEGGFYDFVIAGTLRSLDPAMTRLENKVAADISAMVHNRLIPRDPKTRLRLATFISVQKLRTDAQRQQYFHFGELLRKTLEEREGQQAGNLIPKTSREQSYAEAISMIPDLVKSALPHVLGKSWILYGTTHQNPFYMSDNPVTLYNTLSKSEFGQGEGVAVPGVEIYLPLSDTLCLGLLCPSVETYLRNSLSRIKEIKTPGAENHIENLSLVRGICG
jgi:hypothetical protein